LIYRLGTQAQRVVDSIRDQILSGSLPIGAQLPPHKQLAEDFKVAPLTARHALAFLETQGLISRQQGRGTFVMSRHRATVLVVDDDADIRELLTEQIQARHCAAFTASTPAQGLEMLKEHPQISLVISDVRMPNAKDGLRFIKAVRQGYPKLSLAALTGFPEDLTPLLGTADCPILILSKPIFPQHMDDLLRLVVG
jgi:GntR family transcriptional regulator, arabinose operon transcriptional repressor